MSIYACRVIFLEFWGENGERGWIVEGEMGDIVQIHNNKGSDVVQGDDLTSPSSIKVEDDDLSKLVFG